MRALFGALAVAAVLAGTGCAQPYGYDQSGYAGSDYGYAVPGPAYGYGSPGYVYAPPRAYGDPGWRQREEWRRDDWRRREESRRDEWRREEERRRTFDGQRRREEFGRARDEQRRREDAARAAAEQRHPPQPPPAPGQQPWDFRRAAQRATDELRAR